MPDIPGSCMAELFTDYSTCPFQPSPPYISKLSKCGECKEPITVPSSYRIPSAGHNFITLSE
jgi:hypothetical protein